MKTLPMRRPPSRRAIAAEEADRQQVDLRIAALDAALDIATESQRVDDILASARKIYAFLNGEAAEAKSAELTVLPTRQAR